MNRFSLNSTITETREKVQLLKSWRHKSQSNIDTRRYLAVHVARSSLTNLETLETHDLNYHPIVSSHVSGLLEQPATRT